MTHFLDVSLIDAGNPSAATEVERALREYPNGSFYRDEAGNFLHLGTKDGLPFAHRIAPRRGIGPAVRDMGVICFGRANQHGQVVPLPYFQQAPYIKWLDHLLSGELLQSFPLARGLYNLPAAVLDGEGLIQAHAGYHHDILFTGSMVKPAPGPHLKEWLSALEYAEPVYEDNLYGYILSCFARPSCPYFPFLVVDGITRKVGKSTLVDSLCYLLTGQIKAPFTLSGGEQELEKRIAGSCGSAGPNVIYVDNVRPLRGQTRAIRSQLLAQAATSPTVSVRPVYGKRPEVLDYPILIFTMNGAAVEHDLHDRVVRVVLAGESGRYFKPHPLEYVKEHRQELLAEIMRALISAQIDTSYANSRFGQFEWIARAAAGTLGFAPDYDPDVADTTDSTVQELRVLVDDMVKDAGGQPVALSKVANMVFFNTALQELAAALSIGPTPTDRSRTEALRRFVEKLTGRKLFSEGRSFEFVLDRSEEKGYTLGVR
jgi:hypothetical protein